MSPSLRPQTNSREGKRVGCETVREAEREGEREAGREHVRVRFTWIQTHLKKQDRKLQLSNANSAAIKTIRGFFQDAKYCFKLWMDLYELIFWSFSTECFKKIQETLSPSRGRESIQLLFELVT